MTREKGNSLPTGESNMNGDNCGNIMDTAVIAMVNLYLKNIPLSERCNILEGVVSPCTERAEIESGIRTHIDGAKLAELIDMAKAYLAELLNVKSAAQSAPSVPHGSQPEEPAETVFDTVIGIDMSNTSQHGMIMPGMIYSSDGADTEASATKLKGRVVRVDDIDDDSPKYNPALEMSFEALLNKSWEVLYNLMKNLSGVEYVTHMPYEMAEMITDWASRN